jgi:hypothetical protein
MFRYPSEAGFRRRLPPSPGITGVSIASHVGLRKGDLILKKGFRKSDGSNPNPDGFPSRPLCGKIAGIGDRCVFDTQGALECLPIAIFRA